ncbi:MAG: DUF3990 domain-containing protein [Lachnospiraceae bacterium]|nr:DUF3990 domain-containing protein [Lachnospiraceae bacterium]
MHLYHTSSVEIRKPHIYHGRKNADFGQGFYLTPDREFALRWASKDAMINEYILDIEGLSVYEFSRNEEWFEYIYNNRRFKDGLGHDVIIGPIANDTIYDTFGILTSGFVKPEHAVNILCMGPEYIQVAVKSEKANKNLTWLGANQVDNAEQYKEIVRKEEKEYQEAFSEYLLNISDNE